MFKKLLKGMSAQRDAERRAELYRNLIRHEAKIGGRVFGPVPDNVRREFFCLDERTWVWHEEWKDKNGQIHVQTTRYDVRPDGIIKSQHGKYAPVGKQEARRLRNAVHMYERQVKHEMYRFAA